MKIILRLLTMLCLFCPFDIGAIIVNGMSYTVDYEKNIATCTGSYNPWDVTIPSEIPTPQGQKVPVAIIAPEAFKNSQNLRSLTIESNLQKIGDSAFEGCASLAKINFLGTTDSIGASAFAECLTLQNITFDDKTVYIGDNAFKNCDLRTIQFGNNLRHIGKSAFANINLTELNLPNTLEVISDCAFSNAFYVKQPDPFGPSYVDTYKVSIPSTVIYIGSKAFEGCPLSYITLEDGDSMLLLERDAFVDYPDFSDRKYFTTNFYWGRNVHNANYTFKGADYIRTLRIGEGIKEIVNNQFEGCPNLEAIYYNNLNENFRRIGNSAFKNCDKLSHIEFFYGHDGNLEEVGDSAFYNCRIRQNLHFPASLKKLGESSFANNGDIGLIYFTDQRQVKKIPKHCFSQTSCEIFEIWDSPDTLYIESIPSNIKSLRIYSPIDKLGWALIKNEVRNSITIFNGGVYLKEIPDNAFYFCTNLGSIGLSYGLEEIGNKTFSGASIKSITIPSSVKIIGQEAFSYCTELKTINFGGSKTRVNGMQNIPLDAEDSGCEKLSLIAEECFSKCVNIEQIVCYNMQPPALSKNSFSPETYENAVLRVPYGANYPTTLYWEDFIRTQEQIKDVESLVLNKKQVTTTLSEPFFLNATVYPKHVEYIDTSDKYLWTFNIIDSPASKNNLTFESQYDPTIKLVHPKVPGNYKVACRYCIDQYFYDKFEQITVSDTCLVTILPPSVKNLGLKVPSEFFVGESATTLNLQPEFEEEESYPPYFGDLLIENITPENWTIKYDRSNQTIKITPTKIGIGHCIIKDAVTSKVLKDFKTEIKTLITSMEFPDKSVSIKVGESVDLTYAHVVSSSLNIISISIDDPDEIIRVDNLWRQNTLGFRINGLKPGKANITVKSTDGTDLCAQCEITVLEPTVDITSISIEPSNISGIVGDVFNLKVTIIPENASNKTLTWTSENNNVATISGNGLLSLMGEGSTTITAFANDNSGIRATCDVVVAGDSGIEEIKIDGNSVVKIYNLNGILIYSGLYSDASLSSGTYIIIFNNCCLKHQAQ